MTSNQHDQEISMLRAEIEMLMNERQGLLRASGAAAVFVAQLDSSSLPEETFAAADVLAQALNTLSDETLRESLELVRPEINRADAAKSG
ncbi:MAG TPA: hypothetical protein VMP00_14620 [Burkholderiales bacterium]|nr:hypothetical protein [Burkholderiales bacterium]